MRVERERGEGKEGGKYDGSTLPLLLSLMRCAVQSEVPHPQTETLDHWMSSAPPTHQQSQIHVHIQSTMG